MSDDKKKQDRLKRLCRIQHLLTHAVFQDTHRAGTSIRARREMRKVKKEVDKLHWEFEHLTADEV